MPPSSAASFWRVRGSESANRAAPPQAEQRTFALHALDFDEIASLQGLERQRRRPPLALELTEHDPAAVRAEIDAPFSLEIEDVADDSPRRGRRGWRRHRREHQVGELERALAQPGSPVDLCDDLRRLPGHVRDAP